MLAYVTEALPFPFKELDVRYPNLSLKKALASFSYDLSLPTTNRREPLLATLREYYESDFNRVLSIHGEWKLFLPSGEVRPIAKVHLDLDGNAKFLSYYLPACTEVRIACVNLLARNDIALKIADTVKAGSGFQSGMESDSSTLVYTSKVFIYSETDLTKEDHLFLVKSCADQDIRFCFRGPRYLADRNLHEKPLAFISHDSIDKSDVARPLAIQLQKMMCPVWYDEFSMKVGDSLRESIEKGIKECRKCVLILSPSFLQNNGWTKTEFNSIFTRELIDGPQLILPVWHGVTKKEVYEYCPSLADRLAVDWKEGVEFVARRLVGSIF